MLASVPNPREVFQNDEFLVQLSQQSNVRFSQSEHAPVEERRERFREAIAQRKLPLVKMLASVPNPREVFQNDEFLVQLSQQSNVRFSQSEHAPVEERRERFREAIAQRKLPLVSKGVLFYLAVLSIFAFYYSI
ncbi:hypothetical protein COOONC_15023 [Cooperia oncophora]